MSDIATSDESPVILFGISAFASSDSSLTSNGRVG